MSPQAAALDPRLPTPSVPPVPPLLTRRELFCQHMAAGAGGAEAARRAGYSPCGAKQRACYLMRQPEIRLRIDALRAERRAERQRDLKEAVAVVDQIMYMALNQTKGALALRALDYGLKLRGIIHDKRIDCHGYDRPSPDADLENDPAPPHQDLDGLPGHQGLPMHHDLIEAGFIKDGKFAVPHDATLPAKLTPAPEAESDAGAKHDPDAPADAQAVTVDDHPAENRQAGDPEAAASPTAAPAHPMTRTPQMMTSDYHHAVFSGNLSVGTSAESRPS